MFTGVPFLEQAAGSRSRCCRRRRRHRRRRRRRRRAASASRRSTRNRTSPPTRRSRRVQHQSTEFVPDFTGFCSYRVFDFGTPISGRRARPTSPTAALGARACSSCTSRWSTAKSRRCARPSTCPSSAATRCPAVDLLCRFVLLSFFVTEFVPGYHKVICTP